MNKPWAERLVIESREEQRPSLPLRPDRLSLTKPPIQRVPGTLSVRINQLFHELSAHIHLVQRFIMLLAVGTSSPHTDSRLDV